MQGGRGVSLPEATIVALLSWSIEVTDGGKRGRKKEGMGGSPNASVVVLFSGGMEIAQGKEGGSEGRQHSNKRMGKREEPMRDRVTGVRGDGQAHKVTQVWSVKRCGCTVEPMSDACPRRRTPLAQHYRY